MTTPLKVIHVSDHAIATLGPVLMVIWRCTPTVAKAKVVKETLHSLSQGPHQKVFLFALVDSSVHPPPPEVRSYAVGILREPGGKLGGAAICTTSRSNFLTAMLHSVLGSVVGMLKIHAEVRFCGSAADGAAWLQTTASKVSVTVSAVDVEAAVQDLRGRLDAARVATGSAA